MTSSYLISGVNQGIGRYLHDELGGMGLTRDNRTEILSQAKTKGVDVIIHCASNSAHTIPQENLPSLMADNYLLTQELLDVPHRFFVYFSSVAVYPVDDAIHVENETLNPNACRGVYGFLKLASEELIKKKSPACLILRPTTLLGPTMRPNTLTKILQHKDPQVFLSDRSEYNCVRYVYVKELISTAIQTNHVGILNLAASSNLRLLDFAKIQQRQVKFGSYDYKVGRISNQKASSVSSAFKRTSEEMIQEFIQFDLNRVKETPVVKGN